MYSFDAAESNMCDQELLHPCSTLMVFVRVLLLLLLFACILSVRCMKNSGDIRNMSLVMDTVVTVQAMIN